MNARKFLNVRVGLTVTALALSGAMVLSASCAGSGNSNGGSSGSTAGSTAGSGGGSAGSGGGTAGASGSSGGSCTAGADSVCFSNGQAQGVMKGWGWVALGAQDSLTDPTCDTAKAAITKAAPCTTTTNWSTSDSLCISGSIPALPATPVQSDYDNNWGIQIGVNTSEPSGTGLGKSYNSIALTVTGSPSSGLRAEIHRKGDPDATTYCANMTSGTDIKLTSFNTACWDGSGTSLTSSDVSNIDKVGIQVSSSSSAITVSKLCLTGIQFK